MAQSQQLALSPTASSSLLVPHSFFFFFRQEGAGAGQRVWQLRAQAALAKDPGSVPSSHTVAQSLL